MIMDYVMHYWDGLALLGITMMMAKIVEAMNMVITLLMVHGLLMHYIIHNHI